MVSSGFMPSSGITGSKGNSVLVLSGPSILLSIVVVLIYTATSSVRGFPFLHTLANICCLWFFFFHDGYSDHNKVIPYCSFHLHFSNNWWCWTSFHVFVGLLTYNWKFVVPFDCLHQFPCLISNHKSDLFFYEFVACLCVSSLSVIDLQHYVVPITQFSDFSIHFKMIIIPVTICHHTNRWVIDYIPQTVHLLLMTHLFCKWNFVSLSPWISSSCSPLVTTLSITVSVLLSSFDFLEFHI